MINVGDEIEIVGIRDTKKSVCTGVEMFRKILDRGEAGDNVAVLLRGIDREGVNVLPMVGVKTSPVGNAIGQDQADKGGVRRAGITQEGSI